MENIKGQNNNIFILLPVSVEGRILFIIFDVNCRIIFIRENTESSRRIFHGNCRNNDKGLYCISQVLDNVTISIFGNDVFDCKVFQIENPGQIHNDLEGLL